MLLKSFIETTVPESVKRMVILDISSDTLLENVPHDNFIDEIYEDYLYKHIVIGMFMSEFRKDMCYIVISELW